MAHLTFRLVLGFWLLMTVVLINAYTSTLTSFLTVVKLEPIPDTLEEMVAYYEENNDKCLLTMQQGHPLILRFNVTNKKKNPVYYKILI